jgi:hypothetical protein
MMYLVDLDDTKGNTLTITAEEAEPEKPIDKETNGGGIKANTTMEDTDDDDYDFQLEMQKIIDNAKADMDALAADRGVGIKNRNRKSKGMVEGAERRETNDAATESMDNQGDARDAIEAVVQA